MEDFNIIELLNDVIHPEYGRSLVKMGMIEQLNVTPDSVRFTIALRKPNDPFAQKLKRHAIDVIGNKYPEVKNNIDILLKEPAPKKSAPSPEPSEKNKIKHVVAISSCKGGVGKSTVTANLAVALSQCGYSVGVMDADIYGPSMPKMFGLEGYKPLSTGDDDEALIIPAERHGVKVQSIGFFINPDDALIWRGPMATNTLKQLLHQTAWGELDYLLIDLPPGTGDIHLTIISEIKINGSVIVSTPQELAIADVVRGIDMFCSPHVNVKVLGLVENMAWFTPKELPDNKYYIFGKEGCKKLAEERKLPLLAQIPLMAGVSDSTDSGKIEVLNNVKMFEYFHEMIQKINEQL